MARLTVEDCLENIDNRYDLVLVASKRARQIAMGAEPLVPANQDKPTVIALREIAENLINAENIDKVNQFDEEEEFTEADFAIPSAETPAE
jgi:DNA-directed RNA polymerase subunit omega